MRCPMRIYAICIQIMWYAFATSRVEGRGLGLADQYSHIQLPTAKQVHETTDLRDRFFGTSAGSTELASISIEETCHVARDRTGLPDSLKESPAEALARAAQYPVTPKTPQAPPEVGPVREPRSAVEECSAHFGHPCDAELLAAHAAAPASYSYAYKPGFLAAGHDLASMTVTYDEAVAYCDKSFLCMGFTYANETQKPTTKVHVFFKSAENYVKASGWSAYVKVGPHEYPDRNLTVGPFQLGLRPSSHSIMRLSLTHDVMPPYNFSFVPPLAAAGRPPRNLPGCHQLGDFTMRFQPATTTNKTVWSTYTTAYAGFTGQDGPLPSPPPSNDTVLFADDITPLLLTPVKQPFTPDGMHVTREYLSVASDSFAIKYTLSLDANAKEAMTVGGLGISLPNDYDTTNLKLDQIAYINSFLDPFIGLEHGFAEWVRVVGNVSMVVTPLEGTTVSKLEAWRPLLEDCKFNGAMHEWTIFSKAWNDDWQLNQQYPVNKMPADLATTGVWPDPKSPWPKWYGNETVWTNGTEQWNEPTSHTLQPGEQITFGLRFSLTEKGPLTRDAALEKLEKPTFFGVPGFVLSKDMHSAQLRVTVPAGLSIASVTSSPPGALEADVGQPSAATATSSSTVVVGVRGQQVGRSRLEVQFSDGSTATVHYFVLTSFQAQVANLGVFWGNVSWLPEEYPDPFGRSSSVMPFDREEHRHVLQDSRAFIVGLSDDAGAGANLGFSMKVNFAPTQFEVARLDEYIHNTLYGIKPGVAHTPYKSLQEEDDGVRMTMFYYNQSHFPYNYTEEPKCKMPVGGPIWCMTENMANATYRSFNYPHQTAGYWAMYRVARYYSYRTQQTWQWYLTRAYKTTLRFGAPGVGVMDGTVFREVLLALQDEGKSNSTFAEYACKVQGLMASRADRWSKLTFPYGSEFNFDTTGQEEVYVWLQYFGYKEAAQRTVYAVLAYMRSFPHWAYNGGATSMGDLGNNGKWMINRGTERGLMHYRSGLNAIPLIEHFKAYPSEENLLLLRVAVGAITGQLTNIYEEPEVRGAKHSNIAVGAPSMMFHANPFVHDFDPYSGDYGLGFFGHTLEAGAFLVNSTDHGWLCFVCDHTTDGETVTLEPKDSYKRRVYLAPLGIDFTTDTGLFASVTVDFSSQTISFTFSTESDPAPYSIIHTRATFVADKRIVSSLEPAEGLSLPQLSNNTAQMKFQTPVGTPTLSLKYTLANAVKDPLPTL